MEPTTRSRWAAGLGSEVEHWRHWLRRGAVELAGVEAAAYAAWSDADSLLQPGIIQRLDPFKPPGSEVAILDVGAGPLTMVGKKWPGRSVKITAVDPLADEYDRLLAELDLTPPVRTVYGEAERLTSLFPPDYFDAVICCNALDHVYDCLEGLRQMIAVARPQRPVILLHNIDEGETQRYDGLHQWNFREENGEFIIWNREARWSVGRELGSGVDVEIDLDSFPGRLLVYLQKGRSGVV